LTIIAFVNSIFCVSWYISIDGKDSWSGKIKQPFASLEKAYSVFNEGDEILFFNGNHTNPKNCGLSFKKNVYLGSLDGDPNQSGVICQDEEFGFEIGSSMNATINRLTWTNLNGTGILLKKKSVLTVLESFLIGSNGIQGGAISAAEESKVILNDALITGNSAGRGGAIYCVSCEIKNTGNTRVDQNVATDKGGAFYLINATVDWKQGLIEKNHGGIGGAFYSEQTRLKLYEIEMQLNSADERGGAFYIDSMTVANWEHINLHSNHAEYQGGAIYCAGMSTIDLVQCSVDDNTYDNMFCEAKQCRVADDKGLCTCNKCQK